MFYEDVKMEECFHRKWMPHIPDKGNKGDKSGTVDSITTKSRNSE